MALLQWKAPVDYGAQQGECRETDRPCAFSWLLSADLGAAAFESFLSDFKTSPEQTITHALGNINLGEDDLSDDYDFMDQDDDAHQQRQRERARKRAPQHKYRDMLQLLADRKINEVVIELDDLDAVRLPPSPRHGAES